MSEESPQFSILLNGTQAADYFTTLETQRYVRNQIGAFSVSLDDYQFAKWAALAKYHPAILSINGTRIFKGRIDKILRHYDKDSEGYLTTVTGRDDAGPLLDIEFSKYYYRQTPDYVLKDLINNVYPSRKGTMDPTLTLNESTNFATYATSALYTNTWNWDRVSFWQAVEQVLEYIEGLYLGSNPTNPPLFLDFWVDENDVVQITQTGELPTNIDVGGAGGNYVKTYDWTLDSLPVKNDVWLWGNNKAGILPLSADPFWTQIHNTYVGQQWTDGTAGYWAVGYNGFLADNPLVKLFSSASVKNVSSSSPGLGTDMIEADYVCVPVLPIYEYYNYTSNASFPPIASVNWVGPLTKPSISNPYTVSIPPYAELSMPMPFGPNTPDFQIFRRGPRDTLNWYNNDVTDESMGAISAVNFYMKANIPSLTMTLALIDGQNPDPMAMIASAQYQYRYVSAPAPHLPNIATVTLPWTLMSFPIGPGVGAHIGSNDDRRGWENVFRLVEHSKHESLFSGTLVSQSCHLSTCFHI